MNDLKTIRQLVKLMVDNDLSEIDVEAEGEKIKLKRGGSVTYAPQAAAPAAAPAPAAPSAPAASDGGGDDADIDDGTITIDSPMVGTFYVASNPDSPPFVNVGDSIKPDTVVCIVEAMKVFNEIKAEVSGKVVEVMVEAGQAVEYGQPMFKIKP